MTSCIVKSSKATQHTTQQKIFESEGNTMKRTINYQRAVQYLNKIYKAVNEYYFDNELEPVTITIQSTVTAYGHCSVSKVWTDTDGNKTRELNIAAEYMSRPIENVVATMIHEASHIYNLQNGIKDTSGYYHNKRFKKTAEELAHLPCPSPLVLHYF